MSLFQVIFRQPSYFMHGDESGNSSATAFFRQGGSPDTTPVPLSTNTFTQVGGLHIGGPELIAIELSSSGTLFATLIPDEDFAAGPNSWSVLQCLPPRPESIYELQVFTNGETQVVSFSNIFPLAVGAPPVIEPCLVLEEGAIYNDLDIGLLNVDYVI